MKSRFVVIISLVLMVLSLYLPAITSADQITAPAAPPPVPDTPSTSSDGSAARRADATSATITAVSTQLSAGTGASVAPSGNTGAASASIPIEVPPGRNGIAPNLTLSYNSSRGNGPIGVGWDIGLGEISRSTKRGVDYAANDYVFSLGGATAELVLRGDWGVNYYYGAKIEGAFSKYYLNPSTGGWEVTTKDGTKYFYGTAAASRQDNTTYGIFKWCLDKVQDTNGNYMTITYWKDSGEIYINRIDYTGNVNGLATTNYVQFYYENRPDIVPMFTTNSAVRTAYRLKTIDIFANSNRARTYQLTYKPPSPATGRSLLASVQQYGDDATISLPATTFDYSQAPVQSSWDNPNVGQGYGALAWLTGDIDGDGKTDLIQIFDTGAGSYGAIIYKSNGAGYDYRGGGVIGSKRAVQNDPDYGWFAADIDNDGKAEIIHAFTSCDFSLHTCQANGDVYRCGADSAGNFSCSNSWSGHTLASDQLPPSTPFLAGDVDGDGKTDLIEVVNNSGTLTLQVFKADGNGGFLYVPQSALPSFQLSEDSHWLTGDFNGDGRTDILLINETSFSSSYSSYTIDMYIANGAGYTHIPSFSGQWRIGTSYLITADVNGDGKSDLVKTDFDGVVTVYPWDGSSFFNSSWSTTSTGLYWGHWTAGDINSDGKADLVWWSGSQLFKDASTGMAYEQPSLISGITPNTADGGAAFFPADINGEGRMGLVRPYYNPNATNSNLPLGIAAYYTDGNPADLLIKITKGVASTTIDYKPSSIYLNQLLPFVVQTVSSITVNDGNGNSSPTSYSYSGGYFDFASREFRGFSHVKQINPDHTYSETFYHLDDTYKGLPWVNAITDSNDNVYAVSLNYYLSSAPYTGVTFPLDVSQNRDYLCDGNVTRSQIDTAVYGITTIPPAMAVIDTLLMPLCKKTGTDVYHDRDTYGNTYGNVSRRYSWGDMAVSGDEKDEYIDYAYDTANWIVSTPSGTRVYDSGGGNPKSHTWFDYYAGTPNLKTKTFGLNVNNKTDANNPQINYTYYSNGNLWTTTDARGYTTWIDEYDSTVTYPTKVRNYLGHVVQKTYDVKFGKVLTETDPNGSTITNHYDHFSRLKDSSNQNNGSNAYKWKETYYDGLGRTIKIRTGGLSGPVIVQETKYDIMGRVYQASLPHFEVGESARWTTYYYDPIGRVIQVTNPDSTYSRKFYYQGSTTIVDANNHQKVEVRDVYGRLIEVDEYTGTYPSATRYAITTYEYDALGNLTDVWDAKNYNATTGAWTGLGSHTSISYDTLSRKVDMTDPDMGYWRYYYDKNDNLTSQLDAKSQWIYFQYDEINRIRQKDYSTQKSLGSGDVVYIYDETWSTNSKGRLTTVRDASGMQRFYYDKLGRGTTTIKTVDNIDYTIETTYDSLGRTESITYPDGEIVYYTYDDGGNLTNVSNIINFAGYSGFNALGQPANIAYGNGVQTAYQYWSLNNRLYSITTNGPGGGLQNIAYGYDNAGNVTGITDYLDGSRTQSFVYDELNRIKTAQRTTYETITYTYDEIGNIKTNSRVGGSYTYGAKPHAVTQAGSNTYSYDANGNMYSGGGRSITYDFDNRPLSITKNSTITLVYDYSGQRIKKNSTIYIGKLYECTGGTCTKHIFAGSNRIASKTGTNINYYHTDHLGSSTVVTDTWGNKVQENYYYPFGETRVGGNNATHYKYTGQEEDPETGLYYYGARYYDPVIGRFISADSVGQNYSDPQSLNRFSYCRNNPLIYTDPTGHFTWKHPFRHPFSGIGHFFDTAIAATVGFIVSGFNPVGAAIAAGSNIFLSHTGGGRKVTRSVAKYFFDNFLGLPPDIAYMASSITLNAALSWGLWKGYGALNGTPTATIDTENNVIKDFENNPEYSVLNEAQGESDISGRNISDSGSAYRILDDGQLVGVLGKSDAFGLGVPGLEHTAISIEGGDGVINSMGDWKRGIIELVTGTCHQAANQALLQAGYSLTVNGAASGWFSYVSGAIYGPYGSAAPALSYFDEERNRER